MSRWHRTEFDSLPLNAFQPRGFGHFGGGMTLEGGGKGASAPDPNPGMIASAQGAETTAAAQRDIAANSLDFAKKQYADMKPLYDKIVASDTSTQDASAENARRYNDFQKNTFQPLQQSIVDDANSYDTAGHRERIAEQASGDVTQAFDSARQQQDRMFAASGIKPSSGRFAALNSNLLAQEALGKAGAQTNARITAEEIGASKKTNAANIGNSLAGDTNASYGTSINAGGGATSAMGASGDGMRAGYSGAVSANNGAASAYGTAGNIYGQEFSGRMQGYQANQSASSSAMSGIGGLVGRVGASYMTGGMSAAILKADGGVAKTPLHRSRGGAVKGAGGPVDDKIPAMLSNGEYVLPADTVKAIGLKKLDKVVKNTHTPAAKQRALKGRK